MKYPHKTVRTARSGKFMEGQRQMGRRTQILPLSLMMAEQEYLTVVIVYEISRMVRGYL